MFGCVNVQQLTSQRVIMLVLCTGLAACGARNEPAPVASVYTGKTIYDYERASLAASSYQVEPGETLYSIAFRANKDVRELAKLNNINAPYTIYPGQTLRLNSTASSSQTAKSTPPPKPAESVSKSPSKATSTSVASQQKKEYVKNNGKGLASRKKVTTKVAVPSTGTEPTLTNEDINWQWPSKSQIISDFSLQQAGNKGLDFGGDRGDPVVAAAAGKVVYVGNALRGFGRLIILKHNDDFITAYAHNDELLVKEQEFVTAGQEIARMGSSDADRVKLHFEVRFRGKSVNPRNYLPKQ